MKNEKIREFFMKEIDNKMTWSLRSPKDYFSRRICQTCEYWNLLNEDILYKISKYYPDIYKHMCEGIEGKIISSITLDDGKRDVFTTHMFYGFCERYPPTVGQDDSIVNIGLFSVKKISIPKITDGCRFPVLPENQGCGEWKLSQWGKERLEKEETMRKENSIEK